MLQKNCKKSAIGFHYIDNKSFNKYEEAMDYITQHRCKEKTEKAAIYMLNKQISKIFKACPSRVMRAIKESVSHLEI